MNDLLLGTHAVTLDEPVFCVKEVNERAADSHGYRRMQCIQVVRQDQIAEMRKDLGPAEDFTAAPFWIVTGGRDPYTGRIFCEYTVGEALEMAEQRRSGMQHLEPTPEPFDLIKGHYDSVDKKRRQQKKQSTFGFGGHTQRS